VCVRCGLLGRLRAVESDPTESEVRLSRTRCGVRWCCIPSTGAVDARRSASGCSGTRRAGGRPPGRYFATLMVNLTVGSTLTINVPVRTNHW